VFNVISVACCYGIYTSDRIHTRRITACMLTLNNVRIFISLRTRKRALQAALGRLSLVNIIYLNLSDLYITLRYITLQRIDLSWPVHYITLSYRELIWATWNVWMVRAHACRSLHWLRRLLKWTCSSWFRSWSVSVTILCFLPPSSITCHYNTHTFNKYRLDFRETTQILIQLDNFNRPCAAKWKERTERASTQL